MNTNFTDTIAAVSSGTARAGVAVLRISGSNAKPIVDKLFSKPLKPRIAAYGELYTTEGVLLDNVLALYFPAPHSYTGEDIAEIHTHGSPAVVSAALRAIFQSGARQARAGEFTKRAFLNGKLDLIQAEAVADLIDAETEQAAINAASQLSGAISEELTAVYDEITDLLAEFYAVIDYPDEEIEEDKLNDIAEVLRRNSGKLASVLATFERGRIVKNGVSAVLLGKPNVGKSSLLNALVGYDRAIVTSTPGTTRDTVEEKAILGGVLLRLLDTAGVRETNDAIERFGVERSERALADTDLVFAVLDGSNMTTGEDAHILSLAERSGKPVIKLLNKSDLPQITDIPGALPVSAKTLEGFDALAALITELFAAGDVTAKTSLLSNERQYDLVRRAKEALESATVITSASAEALDDAEHALNHLAQALGGKVTDDVT
ncbi:MAG: tRNA uridine-5-carboxymethylaminomethyl(34) synthesis GTPase MnmE [Oscillospiraceae bacterium]|jgi:tRNA modification GTPase|nr:tRNA uridine-5-carboxymethylaminomethyl(34) synthesis GTPase MnmE [Oscillospiraceae bacterium]